MTGEPGVGKTMLIQRIYARYKARGYRIAGITTREVRGGDRRVGFRITDLSSELDGWLAKVGEGSGPRIGKYTVISKDLEDVGVRALTSASGGMADMVLIDEIGPMEMTSVNFRRAITNLLSSDGVVIATVRHGSRYPEVERVSQNSGVVRIEVSKANRDDVLKKISALIEEWTKNRR